MNQRRIDQLCRAFAAIALMLLIILPPLALNAWVTWSDAELIAQAKSVGIDILTGLQPWQRVVGAVLTLLPLSFVLLGIWCARQCFLQFLEGRYFELDVIRNLRRLSAYVVWSVVVGVVCKSAMSIAMTAMNPAGKRQMSVSFSSQEVFILLFAGLIWVIAAVITHAKVLADEHAQFV